MNIKTLVGFAILAVMPLAAQLASPNSTGAAIGHIHLNVKDIEAQQKFWTLAGATSITNDKLIMMQYPGIYIILRKQDSTGGTQGSVVTHFGLKVKNLNDWLPKWKAAGIKIETTTQSKQFYITAPDDVRVEIIEDATSTAPIAMHHIHLVVPDPAAAQEWYVKNFGGIAGKRLAFVTANVPGTEIAFNKTEMPAAPTKGRSVDHIGFEVKNIDEFVKKLEAAGIKTENPIRNSANAPNLRIAYIFDPFGTYIELTEGLTPKSTQAAAR